MATITVEVDDAIHAAALARAESEHTTLEAVILRWMEEYARPIVRPTVEEAMAFLNEVRSYADTGGRKFTRDEMNER